MSVRPVAPLSAGGRSHHAISKKKSHTLEATITDAKKSSSHRVIQPVFSKDMYRVFRSTAQLLTRRETLGALNLLTCVLLSVQWVSAIHRFAAARPASSSHSQSISLFNQLPNAHPFDIAIQSRTRRFPSPSATGEQVYFPGYRDVRPGTFRSRYPSLTPADVFDDVVVIANPKCVGQWDNFIRHARAAGFRARHWPLLPFRKVSFSSPPLPIAPSALLDEKTANKHVLAMLKRHISYLDAHRRVWQHVVDAGKQRVLILDETIFPSARLQHMLPSLFNNIDQESIAAQVPWHIVTFRRKMVHQNASRKIQEQHWCSNPHYNHPVVRAYPSYGSGMYAMSMGGAQWMLEHVQTYRVPMDVEIALLQKEHGEELVVLSACNNDDLQEFCPDLSNEILLPALTQNFECAWRRLHERLITNQADKRNYV